MKNIERKKEKESNQQPQNMQTKKIKRHSANRGLQKEGERTEAKASTEKAFYEIP